MTTGGRVSLSRVGRRPRARAHTGGAAGPAAARVCYHYPYGTDRKEAAMTPTEPQTGERCAPQRKPSHRGWPLNAGTLDAYACRCGGGLWVDVTSLVCTASGQTVGRV